MFGGGAGGSSWPRSGGFGQSGSGFGSGQSNNQSSGFGQSSNTQSTGFGGGGGGSGFGQQSSSGFGKAQTGFGQNSSTSFRKKRGGANVGGSSPSRFGQNATGSAGGGFGQQGFVQDSSSGGGGFGRSNLSTGGGFGGKSGGGFGQKQSGGFGLSGLGTSSSSNNTAGGRGFGQSSSVGFGQTSSGGGRGFGASGKKSFGGQKQQSSFGQNRPSTGGGGFGQSQGFGQNQSGFGQQNQGGGFGRNNNNKKNTTAGSGFGGQAGNASGGFGSNAGQKGFGQPRGGNNTGGFGNNGNTGSGFGQNASAPQGGFGGNTAAKGFGQAAENQNQGFGGVSKSTGFGNNNNNNSNSGFGKTSTGFGKDNKSTGFGKGGFGQNSNTPNTDTATGGGGFGQNNNNSTVGFGQHSNAAGGGVTEGFGQNKSKSFRPNNKSGGFGNNHDGQGAFGKGGFGNNNTSNAGFGQTSGDIAAFGGSKKRNAADGKKKGFGQNSEGFGGQQQHNAGFGGGNKEAKGFGQNTEGFGGQQQHQKPGFGGGNKEAKGFGQNTGGFDQGSKSSGFGERKQKRRQDNDDSQTQGFGSFASQGSRGFGRFGGGGQDGSTSSGSGFGNDDGGRKKRPHSLSMGSDNNNNAGGNDEGNLSSGGTNRELFVRVNGNLRDDDSIYNYFSQFGDIEEFNNRPNKNTAFMTMANAEDAWKIIRQRNHDNNGTRYNTIWNKHPRTRSKSPSARGWPQSMQNEEDLGEQTEVQRKPGVIEWRRDKSGGTSSAPQDKLAAVKMQKKEEMKARIQARMAELEKQKRDRERKNQLEAQRRQQRDQEEEEEEEEKYNNEYTDDDDGATAPNQDDDDVEEEEEEEEEGPSEEERRKLARKTRFESKPPIRKTEEDPNVYIPRAQRGGKSTSVLTSFIDSGPEGLVKRASGEFVVGTCQEMCPESETIKRYNENAVHLLEKTHPELPHLGPKEKLTVKSFMRSSAGLRLDIPEIVRPEPVLVKTLHYLWDEMLDVPEKGPDPRFRDSRLYKSGDGSTPTIPFVFAFLQDRTRSIRKDFSLQGYMDENGPVTSACVKVFEECARMHIMVDQMLCECSKSEGHDETLNRQEANNCLKALNGMYSRARLRRKRMRPEEYDAILENEAEFRAYYILLQSMDSFTIGNYLRTCPSELLSSPWIRLSLKIMRAVRSNQYMTFFELLRSDNVSYLVACLMHGLFGRFRRMALLILNQAAARNGDYTYSFGDIAKLLCFETVDNAKAFCEYVGLGMSEDGQRVELGRIRSLPSPESIFPRKVSKLIEAKRFANPGKSLHVTHFPSRVEIVRGQDPLRQRFLLLMRGSDALSMTNSASRMMTMKKEEPKAPVQVPRKLETVATKSEPTQKTQAPPPQQANNLKVEKKTSIVKKEKPIIKKPSEETPVQPNPPPPPSPTPAPLKKKLTASSSLPKATTPFSKQELPRSSLDTKTSSVSTPFQQIKRESEQQQRREQHNQQREPQETKRHPEQEQEQEQEQERIRVQREAELERQRLQRLRAEEAQIEAQIKEREAAELARAQARAEEAERARMAIEEKRCVEVERLYRRYKAQKLGLMRIWWRQWVRRINQSVEAKRKVDEFRQSLLPQLGDGAFSTTMPSVKGQVPGRTLFAPKPETTPHGRRTAQIGWTRHPQAQEKEEEKLTTKFTRGFLSDDAQLWTPVSILENQDKILMDKTNLDCLWKLALIDQSAAIHESVAPELRQQLIWAEQWCKSKLSFAGRVPGSCILSFCSMQNGSGSICCTFGPVNNQQVVQAANGILLVVPNPMDDVSNSYDWKKTGRDVELLIAMSKMRETVSVVLLVLPCSKPGSNEVNLEHLKDKMGLSMQIRSLNNITAQSLIGNTPTSTQNLSLVETDDLLEWLLSKDSGYDGVVAGTNTEDFRKEWWLQVNALSDLSMHEKMACFHNVAVAPRLAKKWLVECLVACTGEDEKVVLERFLESSINRNAKRSNLFLYSFKSEAIERAMKQVFTSPSRALIKPNFQSYDAEDFILQHMVDVQWLSLDANSMNVDGFWSFALKDYVQRFNKGLSHLKQKLHDLEQFPWPAKEFYEKCGLPIVDDSLSPTPTRWNDSDLLRQTIYNINDCSLSYIHDHQTHSLSFQSAMVDLIQQNHRGLEGCSSEHAKLYITELIGEDIFAPEREDLGNTECMNICRIVVQDTINQNASLCSQDKPLFVPEIDWGEWSDICGSDFTVSLAKQRDFMEAAIRLEQSSHSLVVVPENDESPASKRIKTNNRQTEEVDNVTNPLLETIRRERKRALEFEKELEQRMHGSSSSVPLYHHQSETTDEDEEEENLQANIKRARGEMKSFDDILRWAGTMY